MEADKASIQHVAETFMSSVFVPPKRLDFILPSSFCVMRYQSLVTITTPEGLASESIDIVKAMPAYRHCSAVKTTIKPDPAIWIYDDIAAILLEYVVNMDGKDVLNGVNVFGVLKTCSGWMISGITSAQQLFTQMPHLTSQPIAGALHRVEAFFEHLRQRQWNGILSDCLPGGGITLSRATGYKSLTWPALIERLEGLLSQTADLDEEIHNPEIHAMGDLALAWTPFTISSDDKVISRGLNIITLLRNGDRWVIAGFQDTNRPV